MTFNSIEFIVFYPIVLLLYFVLPRRAKWPVLLIASYYFYMCYQAELVFLIFGTTLVSWFASRIIAKTERQAIRRLWLILTLVVCLGVLFFYKYFNFLFGSIGGLVTLFGGEAPDIVLNLILPVGISFYTFQTLSYCIDVYRADIEPEGNFFFYALFVSFFPQLVAGPIERPGNLMPQLREPKRFNKEDAVVGAKHMLVGFFKKVCVADVFAIYVNAVYNDAANASSLGVVIATVLFAVQIYCDFSGYTDIAIGCARIMGIHLMQNFNHPYLATTIKEFWSRWHISLSGWFRDYLYIPLGGSRCGKPRHLFNLFVVFLVSGLWHGASWTYVIWGAIHGVYQIVGNLTIKPRNALLERLGVSDSVLVRFVRRGVVFVLVCFAWLFFRANSIGDAIILIKALFTKPLAPSEAISALGLTPVAILTLVLSFLTLLMIDRMMKYEDEAPSSSKVLTSRGSFVYFVWIIMFCFALLLGKDIVSSFIYFQF